MAANRQGEGPGDEIEPLAIQNFEHYYLIDTLTNTVMVLRVFKLCLIERLRTRMSPGFFGHF